jgi:hypothetical protein
LQRAAILEALEDAEGHAAVAGIPPWVAVFLLVVVQDGLEVDVQALGKRRESRRTSRRRPLVAYKALLDAGHVGAVLDALHGGHHVAAAAPAVGVLVQGVGGVLAGRQ